MKAEIEEYDDEFYISIEAETIKEAASLTRMGLNKQKIIRLFNIYCSKEGEFSGCMTVKKNKKHYDSGYIERK